MNSHLRSRKRQIDLLPYRPMSSVLECDPLQPAREQRGRMDDPSGHQAESQTLSVLVSFSSDFAVRGAIHFQLEFRYRRPRPTTLRMAVARSLRSAACAVVRFRVSLRPKRVVCQSPSRSSAMDSTLSS